MDEGEANADIARGAADGPHLFKKGLATRTAEMEMDDRADA